MASFAFRVDDASMRIPTLLVSYRPLACLEIAQVGRTLGTALDRASANHRGRIWISLYCGDAFPSRSARERLSEAFYTRMDWLPMVRFIAALAGYGEAGALGARDRDEATIAYRGRVCVRLLSPSTDWRNGSASDSSPEGYAFESRIGHWIERHSHVADGTPTGTGRRTRRATIASFTSFTTRPTPSPRRPSSARSRASAETCSRAPTSCRTCCSSSRRRRPAGRDHSRREERVRMCSRPGLKTH